MKNKCAGHAKEPTGYLQWHFWAKEMTDKGFEQKLCPICKLWIFGLK